MLKVLSVALACAMPLTVAAGGGGAGGGSNGTVLTVKYYDGAYGKEWLEAAAKDFVAEKKAAGTEISYRLIPDVNVNTSAVNELNSGAGLSDIYMVQKYTWTDWVTSGKLEDLSSVYNTEVNTSKGKQKIKDYMADGYSMQYYAQRQAGVGEYMPWAMPWSMSQIGFVYNENILKETGRQTPPATVEELLAYCADLNAKGITPFAFPGNESHWFRYIIQVWWAQYQGAYVENTLNVTEGEGSFYDYWNMTEVDVLNQKGIQVGIDTVQSLFVDLDKKAWKNSLENVNSYYVKDAEKAFVEGKAAMLLGASFMYSEVEKYMDEGVVYKMMNMPTITGAAQNADGTPMNINYYTSEDFMVVPKAATNKDLAKEFLAYLCNEKYLLDFTTKTGTLRPFKYDDSVLNASTLGLNEFNASVLEVYKTSDVRLVSLPANITNPQDRSLISLYKDMQLNGAVDWASFAKLMREKDSATIMNDVYNATKSEFEDWKTALGV